jgi:hypothetical protein
MKTPKLIALLFLVLCLFSMCKKDPKTPPATTNGEYYVRGTLNGQALNWQVTADQSSSWVVGSSAALSNDQGDISGGITALVSANAGFVPQLVIEFKTIHKTQNEDFATAFNSFVNTGTWTYSNSLDYVIGTKSIVIYYTDSTGKQYATIGTQSGSSANVISVTPVAGSVYNSDSGLKIKLTFNCILYPTDGTGGSLKITNTEATVFLDGMLY